MAPLPPRDQRHLWLRYQVDGYTQEIVYGFKQRLETIFDRQVNRVHILDFKGLTSDMRYDLAERLRMVYIGDDGEEVFVIHAWRRLYEIRAPLVQEFILEFFSTCMIGSLHTTKEMAEDGFGAYWLESERVIPDKGDLSDYRVEISSCREFLRGAPSYTYIRDPYLFRHAERRKIDAKLSRGHFIIRLARLFGLVSDDRLGGLSVVTREIPLIDMGELVKLNICREIGDDWAWVASGLERQRFAATGAPKATEDALIANEGALADPAPVQDVRSLRGLVERSMTDQGRFSTWMIGCMTQLMDASGQTYQAFDGTFRGSSPTIFERRTRQRTEDAVTSAAPQQPDP
nr:hypothetical protein [Tanacetum cinerariifolium]GFA21869.1 hypothetical protein [Tanacetum cinerariifolium]